MNRALIESHCHLIRTTRTLIAWGTTLHVAVDHLATLPAPTIAKLLLSLDLPRFSGTQEHHLGASHRLWMIATDIVEQVKAAAPRSAPPTRGALYILALHELTHATQPAILDAFHRTLRPQLLERSSQLNDNNNIASTIADKMTAVLFDSGVMHT